MARPKSNNPKVKKHFSLSVENVARMELELYSELEGRVPLGAQAELVDRLLTEHYLRVDAAAQKAAILTGGLHDLISA
jgi:hypothetical protein